MHGIVVRGGRLYEAPGQKGFGTIGGLHKGQEVRVIRKALDGAWCEVENLHGLVGFTRSYRIAVNGADGQRLDHYYGYEGWSHKRDSRTLKRAVEHEDEESDECYAMARYERDEPIEGELVEPPVEQQHNPMADLAVMLAEAVAEESEPKIPVQAAILNSGNQMELPDNNAILGKLEPGNNFLAMFDRWMTSKERRKALGTVNDASEARYGFGKTLVRCAVVGLALYGAFTLALKFIP